MENPSRRDPCVVLGVSRVSTDLEIKTAFRKLALKYHPDKNVGNTEVLGIFKEVAYSYTFLSDPERRRQFDTVGFENPADKRQMFCDEKLKSIFDGKDKVGFLEIAKLLSGHFVKSS